MSQVSETGTFSALIDEVISRSGRKDKILDIASYVRSTIRECAVLHRFSQNTIEGTAIVDAVPFIFKRPLNFRMWEAIQYPYFTTHGQSVFAEEKRPSKFQKAGLDYWFYRSGDSFVFNGLAIGDMITYAYQQYLPKLHYFADEADRPARFLVGEADDGVWAYHADYTGNETLNQKAEDLTSNWLIFYWYDLIMEGSLNKIYKTVADERQSTAFALYKSFQKDLKRGESQVI